MSVLFTDSGAGSDANPIGGSWTAVTGFDPIRRVSNQFANSVGSDQDCGAYVNTIAAFADMYSQVRIPTVGGGDAGPAVRIQTASSSQYFLQNSAGTDVNLYLLNGSYTLLDNDAGTYGANDDIYLEIQGTALLSKLAGVNKNSVTDATFATGRGGINMYTAATRFDNYELGDFAGGASVFIPLIGRGPGLCLAGGGGLVG